jgi:hypothetical protein
MPDRVIVAALLCVGLALTPATSFARFVFRAGDTVYVDGKQYTWEEWQRIRGQSEPPAEGTQAKSPAAPPSAQPVREEAPGPRAASCKTSIYHEEFPPDDEKFACSEGLGERTRAELAAAGWRVDFVDKLAPLPGEPTASPRGLPLFKYELVISR